MQYLAAYQSFDLIVIFIFYFFPLFLFGNSVNNTLLVCLWLCSFLHCIYEGAKVVTQARLQTSLPLFISFFGLMGLAVYTRKIRMCVLSFQFTGSDKDTAERFADTQSPNR